VDIHEGFTCTRHGGQAVRPREREKQKRTKRRESIRQEETRSKRREENRKEKEKSTTYVNGVALTSVRVCLHSLFDPYTYFFFSFSRTCFTSSLHTARTNESIMTFFGSNSTKFATQTLQGTLVDDRFSRSIISLGWRSLIKPYILTTVAIGTSVTGGDLICQYLESHKKGPDGKRVVPPSPSLLSWWDRERSRVMCTTAVLVSTPWSFTLARVVERLFPGKPKLR
jgi:hypothetical protein